MSVIILKSEHGVPSGVYDVTYYSLRGGLLFLQKGCDSNVSEAYVMNVARKLAPHEVMHAECQSQPGGLWAFGSSEAERAHKRQEATQ